MLRDRLFQGKMPRLRGSSPATPCREGQVPVLVRVSISKTAQSNQLREQRVNFVYTSTSQSITERKEQKLRQVGNLETGAGTEAAREALLTAPKGQLSLLSYIVQTTCPALSCTIYSGLVLPT